MRPSAGRPAVANLAQPQRSEFTPTEARAEQENKRLERHRTFTAGKLKEPQSERAFKPCGACVQLAAIVSPQRFRIDLQDAADFELRDAQSGKRQDETALHVRRVMPGTAAGSMQVFHGRREKPSRSFGRQEKNLRVRLRAGLLAAAVLTWPIPPVRPAA